MLLLSMATTMNAQESEFMKRTGPYLGEQQPENKPIIFANGIVSSGTDHCSATFSPDGKEIYWEIGNKIGFSKLKNGYWTRPEILSFCKGDPYQYGNPFITPEGEKLFFTSFRPGAVSTEKENIWYAMRTSSGWSDPKPVSDVVNALRIHWSISVSNSGTLYFQGNMLDRNDEGGIYYSKLVNGVYTKPVRMGQEINTQCNETCPYVSPDESFLIFNRFDPTEPENSGIFISYKDKSDRWMPAVRVIGGAPDKGGMSPKITPDGNYLFYVNGGMWWMPSEIARRLRPQE
jgi:hypothetical protein